MASTRQNHGSFDYGARKGISAAVSVTQEGGIALIAELLGGSSHGSSEYTRHQKIVGSILQHIWLDWPRSQDATEEEVLSQHGTPPQFLIPALHPVLGISP